MAYGLGFRGSGLWARKQASDYGSYRDYRGLELNYSGGKNPKT